MAIPSRVSEVIDEGNGATYKTEQGNVFVANGPERDNLERIAEQQGATFSSGGGATQSTMPQMPTTAPQALAGQALDITGQAVQQAREREAWDRLSHSRSMEASPIKGSSSRT